MLAPEAEPLWDDVVHAPLRLQICAMLAGVERAEFAAVRDTLGVSDSVLSKHLRTLVGAGYTALHRATVLSRQRTWVSLTATGRRAYAGHVAELMMIVGAGPG